MKNFKNQSDIIVTVSRPLLELSTKAIAEIIINAEFLAHQAMEVEDQESIRARVLWLTSHNMIEQAELEIAQRN